MKHFYYLIQYIEDYGSVSGICQETELEDLATMESEEKECTEGIYIALCDYDSNGYPIAPYEPDFEQLPII